MWSKAKTVLATIILIAASLTVYFSVYLKAYAPDRLIDRSIPHFSSVPPEYLDPIGGQVVSLAEAQASVPIKIQLPTNTGGRDSFVQVRLFRRQTETNSCSVGIIYASEWIPSSASLFDVNDYYNGIALSEMPISEAWGTLQDAEANMKAFLDQYQAIDRSLCQAVSINGYFGTAGGNVGHCVQWATETTYYYLVASLNCPLSQLVEIAQSIPVN